VIEETPAAPVPPVQALTAAPQALPTPAPGGNGVESAAASLIEAGVRFIETISIGPAVGDLLAGLITRDPRTDRPALSIPLPESVTQERLAGAISALLKTAARVTAAAGGSVK
jgi:hypothetical protein